MLTSPRDGPDRSPPARPAAPPAPPPWRLPAEWEPQDGVLLAWPHADTPWRANLAGARRTVVAIAAAIVRFERVVLVGPDPAAARAALAATGARLDRVTFVGVPTNDTWARDFGPLTLVREEGGAYARCVLDFGFNGWGGKYRFDDDAQVTERLHAAGLFGRTPRRAVDVVLEGGSIDTDGRGTLLTTASCLLHPNRNPRLDRAAIEAVLREELGARRVLWLAHGELAGDDTDGHVDMLARFAPEDTLLYTACDDPADAHAAPLGAMAAELRALRTAAGRPYRLVPLPWPRPVFDADGQRLPASYANFLVIGGAVLVPAYGDPADAEARARIGRAFPGREPIGVDCSPLIRQHGSLHCMTMQLPRGTLA